MLGLVIREMGVLENWHVVPSKCYFPFGEVEGRGDKNLPGMRRWAERGRFRNVSQIKWLWSKFLENTSVLPVEYKGKLWRQGKYLKNVGSTFGKEHSGTFALRTWWARGCKGKLGRSYLYSKILVQHSNPTRWNIAKKGFERVKAVRWQHISQGVSLYIIICQSQRAIKIFSFLAMVVYIHYSVYWGAIFICCLRVLDHT